MFTYSSRTGTNLKKMATVSHAPSRQLHARGGGDASVGRMQPGSGPQHDSFERRVILPRAPRVETGAEPTHPEGSKGNAR